MGKLKEIEINQFQLSVLLNEQEKANYEFLLEKGVLCSTCTGICPDGITVAQIYLGSLNDIVVAGTCNKCHNSVVRVMEFGERPDFFEKAMLFRERLTN